MMRSHGQAVSDLIEFTPSALGACWRTCRIGRKRNPAMHRQQAPLPPVLAQACIAQYVATSGQTSHPLRQPHSR